MSKWLHQQPLILASSSPNRRQLLTDAGLSFTVIPSLVDEAMIKKQKRHHFNSGTSAL